MKAKLSVYMIVRSLISAHFCCVIPFLHPVKTFIVGVLLPVFPFCPHYQAVHPHRVHYVTKMEDVCSCQTAFVWNVKDRAVGQSFLIIPWLRNGCHTPVYWKTRYSVKVAGYFGNYVLYSPKIKIY